VKGGPASLSLGRLAELRRAPDRNRAGWGWLKGVMETEIKKGGGAGDGVDGDRLRGRGKTSGGVGPTTLLTSQDQKARWAIRGLFLRV